MADLTIVYGSGGGNTKLVCERVAEILSFEHTVHLHNAKLATPSIFEQADVLILASPTYGHGQMEQYMERLLSQVPQLDFENKPCAVIALGDDLYDADYAIESAKILTEFVHKHKGKMIVEPLEILKSPIPHLETTVKTWADSLLKKLS